MSALRDPTTALNGALTLLGPSPVHAMLVTLCQVTEEHAMVGISTLDTQKPRYVYHSYPKPDSDDICWNKRIRQGLYIVIMGSIHKSLITLYLA